MVEQGSSRGCKQEERGCEPLIWRWLKRYKAGTNNRKTELQWAAKGHSRQESHDLRCTKIEATVDGGERGEKSSNSSEATHQPMNAWFGFLLLKCWPPQPAVVRPEKSAWRPLFPPDLAHSWSISTENWPLHCGNERGRQKITALCKLRLGAEEKTERLLNFQYTSCEEIPTLAAPKEEFRHPRYSPSSESHCLYTTNNNSNIPFIFNKQNKNV